MAVDHYKAKLRHAMWTWREGRTGWYGRAPRNKDRVSGRNDKRSARQMDREEIAADEPSKIERRFGVE